LGAPHFMPDITTPTVASRTFSTTVGGVENSTGATSSANCRMQLGQRRLPLHCSIVWPIIGGIAQPQQEPDETIEISHNGTRWQALGYAVEALPGHFINADANNTLNPTCQVCNAGAFSGGGNVTSCAGCNDEIDYWGGTPANSFNSAPGATSRADCWRACSVVCDCPDGSSSSTNCDIGHAGGCNLDMVHNPGGGATTRTGTQNRDQCPGPYVGPGPTCECWAPYQTNTNIPSNQTIVNRGRPCVVTRCNVGYFFEGQAANTCRRCPGRTRTICPRTNTEAPNAPEHCFMEADDYICDTDGGGACTTLRDIFNLPAGPDAPNNRCNYNPAE